MEEMGRACLLSPFHSTVVCAASAIAEAGSDEQKQRLLPAIAGGKLIATLALTEAHAAHNDTDIQTLASKHGNSYIINGTKLFVPDALATGVLVCAARTGSGITLFLVAAGSPGVKITPQQTIAGDKQCEVTFGNTKVAIENVLGEMGRGNEYIKKVAEKAAVARCAEMVGIASQVLDMALTYARERMAFGHPIGAYQAIQHRCADMLTDVTGSRFITYQAAWHLSQCLPAEKEVAMAKAWVSAAVRRVVTSAHQVFGTIGFTEDHVLQLYTKRARAYEFSYGDVHFHLDKLAGLV
jgi:alkylation response protein AidB-like acyl-CoA dehydrogenase